MRKRILIVDDELAFLSLIRLMLEGTGFYQVRTVNLSSQVSYVAHHFQPDLILLDCMMPGLDGAEIVRLLQLDPILKKIPVCFFTSAVSEVCEQHIKGHLNTHAFIPKLTRLDKLVRLIDSKILRDEGCASEHQPETKNLPQTAL
jgi:CheY-like chemotaxis protein